MSGAFDRLLCFPSSFAEACSLFPLLIGFFCTPHETQLLEGARVLIYLGSDSKQSSPQFNKTLISTPSLQRSPT